MTCGLHAKAQHAGGFKFVNLKMSYLLQNLVQRGRDETNRAWIDLTWAEVDVLHIQRIDKFLCLGMTIT